MDHATASAYLRRIGLPTEIGRPDAALLRELHVRHLRTVPFENLSIHLDEPITLDEDALVDKIVRRRRGGFCYELNGAFAALLEAVGFPVIRHAARVFGDGGLGVPFDHLALTVDASGERWVADVGFGRHACHPLRLDWPDAQDDPDGEYLVVDAPEGDIDVLCDGRPQYRMEQRSRTLDEFRIGAWWNSTSPASHFTEKLVCSRNTEDGRVTLTGDTLITTVGAARTETTLDGEQRILDTYRTVFGFTLDRLPRSPYRAR
ncbi:MAG: arylamine N-acetyltransferase family protein [Labedaea sp.]